MYATGKYGLRGLLKIMTEKGLVSRSGKPMGVSGLHAALTNPFYCGQVRWGGELMEGGHERLVSCKTFKQVTLTLKSPRRTTKEYQREGLTPDIGEPDLVSLK